MGLSEVAEALIKERRQEEEEARPSRGCRNRWTT